MFNRIRNHGTISASVARASSRIALCGCLMLLAGCAWLDRNDATTTRSSVDRTRLAADSPQIASEAFVRGHLDAYVGSPLSGPLSDTIPDDAFDQLYEVRLQLRRVTALDPTALSNFRPLPGVSTLIALRTLKPIPDHSPIFGVNRITQDILISTPNTSSSNIGASSNLLINTRTLIAPNTTIRYRDRERATLFTLELHRTPTPDATSIDIVLSLAGSLPPDPDAPAGSAPIDAVETVRVASLNIPAHSLATNTTVAATTTTASPPEPFYAQTILVPLRLIDRPTMALRPSDRSASVDDILVFDITLLPHAHDTGANNADTKSRAETSSLVTAVRSELARSAALARIDDVGNWPGFESALRAARDPAQRRRALVWIASQTSAMIARDHLLLASDDELNAYHDLLRQDLRASTLDRKPELLGWLMDLRSLHRLKSLASDNKLPPSLAGILSIHAGALSRDPSSLDAVLRGVRSRDEFDSRLRAEHLIALEDSSPAIRVDAFEFLRARNQAPANYDPLASDADRAHALEALEAD